MSDQLHALPRASSPPQQSRRPRRADVLPRSLPPRGLHRAEAAAYIGVSPSFFDQLVADGRMPQPKRLGSRTIWDRVALDQAFAELPDEQENNPWDEDD